MAKEKSVELVIQSGDKLFFHPPAKIFSKVPSGTYKVFFDHRTNQSGLTQMEFQLDKIVDLDTPEYNKVIRQISHFIMSETKEKYEKFGTIYKRNVMCHGAPGTGKTVMSQKVSQMVQEMGGITIFVSPHDHPEILSEILDNIRQLQDTMIVVLLEEFDTSISRYESNWLSILDGESQVANIIYIATTNYLEKIPARILRPGRFSTKIEFGTPNRSARLQFIKTKIDDDGRANFYADKTEGLTIDQIKAIIVDIELLGEDPEESFKEHAGFSEDGISVQERLDNTRNRILREVTETIASQWAVPSGSSDENDTDDYSPGYEDDDYQGN